MSTGAIPAFFFLLRSLPLAALEEVVQRCITACVTVGITSPAILTRLATGTEAEPTFTELSQAGAPRVFCAAVRAFAGSGGTIIGSAPSAVVTQPVVMSAAVLVRVKLGTATLISTAWT